MVSRGSTPTALFVNVPLLSIGTEPRAAGEISLGEGTLPETLPDIQANLSAVSFHSNLQQLFAMADGYRRCRRCRWRYC